MLFLSFSINALKRSTLSILAPFSSFSTQCGQKGPFMKIQSTNISSQCYELKRSFDTLRHTTYCHEFFLIGRVNCKRSATLHTYIEVCCWMFAWVHTFVPSNYYILYCVVLANFLPCLFVSNTGCGKNGKGFQKSYRAWNCWKQHKTVSGNVAALFSKFIIRRRKRPNEGEKGAPVADPRERGGPGGY